MFLKILNQSVENCVIQFEELLTRHIFKVCRSCLPSCLILPYALWLNHDERCRHPTRCMGTCHHTCGLGLHLAKIEVRPNVLNAARIHVLSHLEGDVSVDQAEVLAGVYIADFIQRYTNGAYVRPNLTIDLDHPLTPDTRKLLLHNIDRICHKVFWLHYSDGSSLERTARKVGKPLRAVESICKLFRKRMRQIGTKQGLSIETWSDERVDETLVVCRGVWQLVWEWTSIS